MLMEDIIMNTYNITNYIISLITNQKILLNYWVSQSKRYNVGIERGF